ncbi:MAG: hypothetical protein KDA70_21460, partial [Planctomycetaceae bacterium]|nr:hypothetical protein [Planctomycetaceae bacterium]
MDLKIDEEQGAWIDPTTGTLMVGQAWVAYVITVNIRITCEECRCRLKHHYEWYKYTNWSKYESVNISFKVKGKKEIPLPSLGLPVGKVRALLIGSKYANKFFDVKAIADRYMKRIKDAAKFCPA